jgi:transcription elongation factor/antiterminator RfaH
MSDCAWYVIQSKPHKENQLCSYLRSQGLEVYYPTLHVKPANPRSSKIRPLFPRYLFVHTNLEEIGMSALRWLPHAIGIVQFDGYAAPVPDAIMFELKRRVDALQAAGGPTFDGLKPGDRVRITQGALAGYEALFDMRLSGGERVQVLLEMLGRQVRMQLHASAIERPH